MIYISPSDQWSNTAYHGKHSEAKHCTEIAREAEKYLKLNGYSVIVGDNTKEKTYIDRVKESNRLNADVHICIHTNAGGGVGTLMLAHPNSTTNKYVTSVYNEVAKLTPTKDRGIVPNSGLYEIKNTKAVCVYLEVEFHDNPTTEAWIDANIKNIGMAIARGVCFADNKDFIVNPNIDKPKPEEPTIGLIKVQAGAFNLKKNADCLAKELKDKGFDSYIYFKCNKYVVQVGAYKDASKAKNLVENLKNAGFEAFAYQSV